MSGDKNEDHDTSNKKEENLSAAQHCIAALSFAEGPEAIMTQSKFGMRTSTSTTGNKYTATPISTTTPPPSPSPPPSALMDLHAEVATVDGYEEEESPPSSPSPPPPALMDLHAEEATADGYEEDEGEENDHDSDYSSTYELILKKPLKKTGCVASLLTWVLVVALLVLGFVVSVPQSHDAMSSLLKDTYVLFQTPPREQHIHTVDHLTTIMEGTGTATNAASKRKTGMRQRLGRWTCKVLHGRRCREKATTSTTTTAAT